MNSSSTASSRSSASACSSRPPLRKASAAWFARCLRSALEHLQLLIVSAAAVGAPSPRRRKLLRMRRSVSRRSESHATILLSSSSRTESTAYRIPQMRPEHVPRNGGPFGPAPLQRSRDDNTSGPQSRSGRRSPASASPSSAGSSETSRKLNVPAQGAPAVRLRLRREMFAQIATNPRSHGRARLPARGPAEGAVFRHRGHRADSYSSRRKEGSTAEPFATRRPLRAGIGPGTGSVLLEGEPEVTSAWRIEPRTRAAGPASRAMFANSWDVRVRGDRFNDALASRRLQSSNIVGAHCGRSRRSRRVVVERDHREAEPGGWNRERTRNRCRAGYPSQLGQQARGATGWSRAPVPETLSQPGSLTTTAAAWAGREPRVRATRRAPDPIGTRATLLPGPGRDLPGCAPRRRPPTSTSLAARVGVGDQLDPHRRMHEYLEARREGFDPSARRRYSARWAARMRKRGGARSAERRC